MVTTAFLATALSVVSAASAVVWASLWAARLPSISLVLLSATLVVGQVWRLPLPGQGGGLLASDVAVVLVLWAALWQRRFVVVDAKIILSLLLPFIIWSIVGLIMSPLALTPAEYVVAAAYWVRLSTHLLLLPALLVITATPSRQRLVARLLQGSVLLVVVIGLMQIVMVPRLENVGGGWDPHVYRLVSSWLDPNLVGGFFAILLPWLAVRSLTSGTHRVVAIGLTAVTVGALLLTQSRSSLVALVAGLMVVSPIVIWQYASNYGRTMRVAVAGVSILLVIGISTWLVGDRAWGLVTYDPTVTLRLQSLSAAWSLVLDHPLVGVGYNAYQFAAPHSGATSDFTNHSRAGTDNSWLVVWVTTGIGGLILFLLPWLWILQVYLRQAVQHQSEQLAVVTGLVIWAVHSQFVHSGLYAHLLIASALLLAATWPRTYD